ncbi:MAG: precorrin-3B C(17)-methyltransferase [Rhodospirillaceae bacterium]|nr:precorrin-3B C(17)-methyltransferase [Rhodospirillaceae bacterium]
MSGHIHVVGLGPGDAAHVTPAASAALAQAGHLIGYGPYLARVSARPGQVIHASDNRAEMERAHHALSLAAAGETVAIVSSGDAGIFAMAATLFEAIETLGEAGQRVDVTVVPGVTAMVAAAARLGAPLGHDFCAISLSDNLKPWETILGRVRAAAEADFVLAFYNPISKARLWQLGEILKLLRTIRAPRTPVIFATAISRPDEHVQVVDLANAEPKMADMRTLVIVGSSASRCVPRGDDDVWIYTPRRAAAA